MMFGCTSNDVNPLPTPDNGQENINQEDNNHSVIDDDKNDDNNQPVINEDKTNDSINEVQKNSLAMLNYLMLTSQRIVKSEKGKMYLEEIGNSMLNDFNPNAIDKRTQGQISDLYRTVNGMRMIEVKRERLAFIYDQNRARAIMSAIPSPMSLLNVVQSGNPLKAVASVLYMAVDSYSSYNNAMNANEMQYLQDGWELEDAMRSKIESLSLDAFNYAQDIKNDYELDGSLMLNLELSKQLIEWENSENVDRRIEFLKKHQSEYKACGYYWLILAKSCFEVENG